MSRVAKTVTAQRVFHYVRRSKHRRNLKHEDGGMMLKLRVKA